MSLYQIDIMLNDGSVRETVDHHGDLSGALKVVFQLADELSMSTRAEDAEVQWIEAWDGATMVISIHVVPGVPLTGPDDLQFPANG